MRLRPRFPILLLCLAFTLRVSGAAPNTTPAAEVGTLPLGGYTRSYLVYVPEHLPNHPAMVLMLHGRGGTKEQAAKEFGWLELAKEEEFIVVFPQALPILPSLPPGSPAPTSVPFWLGPTNDTLWWPSEFVRNLSSLHHPDDGIFLTRLIAKMAAEKHVDPGRIFIAGFSSGGAMVADLAARFPNSARAFAAVAAVGGLRPTRLSSPASLLLFDGDADPTLPNPKRWAHIPAGEKLSWFGQTPLPTLSSEAASWAVLDGCKRSVTQSIPWGQHTIWNGCRRHAHLEVFLVHDLGHEWPGNSVSDWNRANVSLPPLNVGAVLWQFFNSVS